MSFFDNPAINLTVTGWTLCAPVGLYKGCSLLASAVTTSHKVKAAALILASVNVFAGVFLLVRPREKKASQLVMVYAKFGQRNFLSKIVRTTIGLHTLALQQALKRIVKYLKPESE